MDNRLLIANYLGLRLANSLRVGDHLLERMGSRAEALPASA
ncbi:MAG: hypothetical protein ACXVRV_00680 [Gaiellaceae bacterium]